MVSVLCHGVLRSIILGIERCQLEKPFVQKDELSGGYVARTVVFGYNNEDNFCKRLEKFQRLEERKIDRTSGISILHS